MTNSKPNIRELRLYREQLKKILILGIKELYSHDFKNIDDEVSERNLCARLAHYMECILKRNENLSLFSRYFVDVEYNRMANGHPKMIANDQNKVVCDLLIHSRGQLELDNLLAIEMKKGNSKINSQKDKNRLKLLTTWEENLECVRNTMLGAFVRIKKKSCEIEFYEDGEEIYDELSNSILHDFINRIYY